jgi:hypothetical protein
MMRAIARLAQELLEECVGSRIWHDTTTTRVGFLNAARDPMHRARQHGIIALVSAAVREVSCSLAARLQQ